MKKDVCPVKLTLDLVGNKWRLLIVRDLLGGRKRFGELKKSLAISQRSLTMNLQFMEKHGFIEKKIFNEVPPHTEYCLTDFGKTLEPLMKALEDWGNWYRQVKG